MIRYSLACDKAHAFESWFPSSEAYDAQVKRGLVTCPVCDSPKVDKQIMAPSVARRDQPQAVPAAPPSGPPSSEPAPVPAQPVALLSEPERAMRAMLRAIREHVTKTADDVGKNFPDEARKMHHGEIEHRSIYGEANPAEAKALVEEGIEIHPLPLIPDDRH